jgi:FixJ family two-component response regulator
MAEQPGTVIIVDDDPDIRSSLGSLLRSVGLNVISISSVAEFFQSAPAESPACIVLDVRLPGKSGLDFQRDLVAAGLTIPIIFISGHGDIQMTVEALKAGAIDFLTKPVRDQDLIESIESALLQDRERSAKRKVLDQFRERVNSLSQREHQVFALLIAGHSNKTVATEIGIGEVTVKFHRANIARKLGTSSLTELAVMAERLRADTEGR